MPVTAKLSRKFYEQFGDELTNELVEWLNQVDASYRAEFRDLFEVNFARFDAKLDQRAAEIRAELGETFTRELAAARVGWRDGLAAARVEWRDGLAAARVEWRDGLATQRGELTAGLAGLRTEMATFRAELLRWVLLLWIGMLGTLVALLKL
jgi:hypothetical protein